MLCTVILNLSAVTELTEGTVTVLVEHIRTCFKMLSDSLTGYPCCCMYLHNLASSGFYFNRYYCAKTKHVRFYGKSF